MPPTPRRRRVEEHRDLIIAALHRATADRAVEPVPVTDAAAQGRAAAVDVVAEAPLPGQDNSQMDGYAVRAADLAGPAEVRLPLAGVVAAGSPAPPLAPGTAVAIMTGAPVPAGADLVIPVESSETGDFDGLDRRQEVCFPTLRPEERAAGRFIRRAGEDVAAGERIIRAGEVLTPARLGLAAACGRAALEVLAPVRALVLATGDEVRAPGDELAPGQIHDADTALIAAALRTMGCEVTTCSAVADDVSSFLETVDALIARHQPDLLVTSGGISRGAFEVVRGALAARGAEFGAVAQQPGGPQGLGLLARDQGTAGECAVVCLPGNPVSAAVSLETLLRPALAAVDPACPPTRRIRARVDESCSSPAGVRQYRRVRLAAGETDDHGVADVELVGGPGSHLLGHLARADALLELGEDDVDVAAGSVRDAIMLPGAPAPDPCPPSRRTLP